jgi:large subunit ribosomal protein L31
MKTAVHPELMTTEVSCASCGAGWETRSTRATLTVEVCSSCHPAYTGGQRQQVRGDRIERFERRRRAAGGAR